MPMIDASCNVFSHLSALKAAGVTSVGRYYSAEAWKLLTAKEAQAIRTVGLSIVAVYEDGATPGSFNSDNGTFAAQRALQCAAAVKQEPGTALYFAVDFDADESTVNSNIIPYFEAVRAVLQSANPRFRIGAYGSGLVCRMLLDAGLCQLAWLSQSTGYREYAAFKASNRWAIAQGPSTTVAGLGVDSDETRDDFGAFPPSLLAAAMGSAPHALAASVEATADRVILAGSSRRPVVGAVIRGRSDIGATINVTVVLKRKAEIPHADLHAYVSARPGERAVADHAEFAERYGADDEAISAVRDFATQYGLSVVAEDAKRRVMTLSGSVEDMERAFGTTLHDCEFDSGVYRSRQGPLLLPAALCAHVEAVLGLDNRPVAKPRFRSRSAQVSYYPNELAALYHFPAGDGSGQTVALIELGGNFDSGDLAAYWQAAGLPRAPEVRPVSVSSGYPVPYGQDQNSDGEVMLDIEVVGGMAPGADIVVYFAENSDQGFYEAVSQAIHDPATTAVSISWGSAEKYWTHQTMNAWDTLGQGAALLNVPIFVAAGDHGCVDEVQGDQGFDGQRNVDFPGSCVPGVFACGGTSLRSSDGAIVGETVWNDNDGWASGGGVSIYFQAPQWQKGLSADGATPLLMRGTPDVAGNADPATGINVIVGHQPSMVSGGTSAVAPQWAALTAVLSQNIGQKVGFFLPLLYGNIDANATNDIVQGDNGVYGVPGFAARVGWDACTGLGSPKGSQILALLGGAPAKPVPPTPTPDSSSGSDSISTVPAGLSVSGVAATRATFDVEKATLYGRFVAAAYAMFDGDPGSLTPLQPHDFPSGFLITAWIQMQDFLIENGPPKFYGFIAQNQRQPNQFVLAIRGTANPEEWWDDFNAAYRTAFKDPGCGTVGSGFAKIYGTLELSEPSGGPVGSALSVRSLKGEGGFARQVAAHIRGLLPIDPHDLKLTPSSSVAVTGHSLGSALATLYAMDNAIGDHFTDLELYTFASPLVGDPTFAAKFNSLGLASWRIVNRPDMVPNVPPTWLGFEHIDREVLLDSSGKVNPSFGCWHSLATYLSLIDPACQPDPDCRIAAASAGTAVATPQRTSKIRRARQP